MKGDVGMSLHEKEATTMATVTVLSVTLTLLLVVVLLKVFIVETGISLMEVDCHFMIMISLSLVEHKEFT